MDTILVPVDGSDPAENALRHACEQYPSAEITAIHVVNSEIIYTEAWMGGVGHDVLSEDRAHEYVEPILEQAREIAGEFEQEITTEVLVGEPVRKIVSYAEELGADGIVIGTHGRTGVKRVLLGSVAERVARRAAVHVTIVPA